MWEAEAETPLPTGLEASAGMDAQNNNSGAQVALDGDHGDLGLSGSRWDMRSGLGTTLGLDSIGKEVGHSWDSIGRGDFGGLQLATADDPFAPSRWDSGGGGGDEQQAELFHVQWQLIREQISVLSRELIQARSEIRTLHTGHADLHAEVDNETTHRHELAARLEASVKAVADEADAACRGLQAEVADRIAAQERTLRDISASEDRQAKNVLEVRHQCDAINDQVDALRLETQMDTDRLRGQIMELNGVLENERRDRCAGDDNLHRDVAKLKELIDAETATRSSVGMDVDKALKSLGMDIDAAGRERVALEQAMKQCNQEYDDRLEQETKARIAGDTRNEKALEAVGETFKAELQDESVRTKNAMRLLSESCNRVAADLESEVGLRMKQEDVLTRQINANKVAFEKVHKDLHESLDQEIRDRSIACEGLSRALALEERDRTAGDIELHSDLDSTKRALEENFKKLLAAQSDIKGNLDSENKERQASTDKLNADLRTLAKLLGDQVAKETEERSANHAEVLKFANAVKALTEQEGVERRASQDEMRKRHKQLAELVESEKSSRDLHCSKLENQLQTHAKNHEREKEARVRDHDTLKSHMSGMEDRIADEIREMQSSHDGNMKKLSEGASRGLDDLRSALEAHASAANLNTKEFDAAVKTLRQQLDQEVKVRATESAQALAATQDAHEKMQADTAKLQKLVGDNGERLKATMEGLATEGKNRSDQVESLMKNIVGLSEGLEKEKVERENSDSNIKLQLSTTRQELGEEKDERGNDCATLKRYLQNLEAQVSSQMEELRMNHEGEVNRNTAAHEKVEQAHRELKNGLEQHGVLHEENTQELHRAILGLKKMSEQETKTREADSLKTAAAFTTVSNQMEAEASKSAKAIADLIDKLKRLADELGVETQSRITGDETSLKQLHNLDLALQSEKADRESGDGALRAHVQNCDLELEKEKEARLNETSETRRGVQSLEGTLSQHLEDLKLNIEVEIGKRTASDDRLEKKIHEVKLAVDTHEQSRTQIEAELDKAVKSLRAALDAETRSREDAMAEKSTMAARMETRLESLIKEHSQVSGDLFDRLKRLGEELQAEARERASSDEEITEIAMIARNFIEKESKDRQKSEEEYNKKHSDLHATNNQQHATRDLFVAGLEGSIKDHAKMHAGEKEERMRETAELRRSLQAMSEKVNAMAAEIRMEHEMEKKKLGEKYETLDRGLTDLKGSHGSFTQMNAKKIEDHKDQITGLRDGLEQESKVRNKEKTLINATLNQLQAKLESETGDRAASISALAEQIRLLSEALNVENQERSAGLQREITMRDQALMMMKQQVEGVKTSISIEKDERTAEVATLSKKTATADSQLAQKLEELRVNLEGEASLRATGDERVERRLGELRTNFDAHTSMTTGSLQELDQRVRTLGSSLDTEVRARVEEASKHVSANNQLKEMLAVLETAQLKGNVALQEKVKGIGETLLEHEKNRAIAGDEVSKKIKDVIAVIETERHDREQGVANVKNQMETVKQLVASEKEDRINELSTFRRSLHVEDGKVKQALEDLKHSLEQEANKRQSADDRLDKRCSELKSGLEEASKSRVEMSEEFDRTNKLLRQALDQEVRVRVEENAKVGSAINRLQDSLDGETVERQQSHSDCIDRIRIVSENLNAESKERAAGDDESAKLVIAVRQALEKEMRERKVSELDMEQKLQEYAASGEHEKGDRERENAAMRAQIASLRQDQASERDERAADIAACKRNVSALEGHTMQQLKDVRQSLDSETSERIMANERAENVCNDIRGIIEADRQAHDITAKDLDRAIKQNRQATETETKERNNLFEENHQNLTEIRQMLSNFRGEAMSEKEDRIEDVSALRMLLQNIDQKLMVQLREYKSGLENEITERVTNTERLEKRLAELRGAVLVAVRGPGAR